MKLKPLIVLSALVFLSSCKGGKMVTGSSKADPDLLLKNIVLSHDAASPNFNTLAARVQVAYEDEKKSQSITVSVRMEKDKVIWVKASILGITLAKAMITPERVSYYETISNTYFDGDFALLSNWLGAEIDFKKAQAILLGQSIFEIDQGYGLSIWQNQYRIQPNRQPDNFIHSIFLRPDNFKIASESLAQPRDNRMLSLRYGDYQLLEGGYFPTEIFINAEQEGSHTNIEMKYKKIDLDVNISFPFSIPNGYEEIQL